MLISKFDNSGIEKHIEEFEEKYNFKFPEQYRNFLLKYNGGETPETDFKINKVGSDIRAFYGLGKADEHYNYEIFWSSDEIRGYLKHGVLPIAENVWGDYVVIGTVEKNSGKIFFYYHDRPRKYIPLAEDFVAFARKCKSEKIGHIMTIEERKKLVTANGFADEIPDLMPGWQEEIDTLSQIHQEELLL